MVSAIIVAAGEGKRFSGSIPKLYLTLGDKPIIVHTLLAFSLLPLIDEIILVIRPEEEERAQRVIFDFAIKKIKKIVKGGRERQDSVASGLREISSLAQIVLVHDGARPLVDKNLITRVVKEASSFGAVVPVIPCEDTIKEVKGDGVARTLCRDSLWAVQTPQGFKKNLLLSAYEKAQVAHYYGTDDAELLERLGHPIKVIFGAKENIKITTPFDLELAKVILNHRFAEPY